MYWRNSLVLRHPSEKGIGGDLDW